MFRYFNQIIQIFLLFRYFHQLFSDGLSLSVSHLAREKLEERKKCCKMDVDLIFCIFHQLWVAATAGAAAAVRDLILVEACCYLPGMQGSTISDSFLIIICKHHKENIREFQRQLPFLQMSRIASSPTWVMYGGIRPPPQKYVHTGKRAKSRC